MSIRWMTKVWDEAQGIDGTALVVLLCIADHAQDDTGCAWPSIARLAQRSRRSERTVQEALLTLEDAGWIVREHRPGRSTMYHLLDPTTPAAHRTPAESAPPQPTAPPQPLTPAVDRTPPPQPTAPITTNEPSPPTSPSSSVTEDDVVRTEVPVGGTVVIDDEVKMRAKAPLPVVYQRLLAQRHNVVTAEQQAAWSTAWDSAEGIKGDVPFEPYDHLAIYLTGCSEGRHRASAQTWLRFFIEDRGKHVAALAADADRRAIAEETPQEREDRYTRRRPSPAAYGSICHGCGCMPATEPHKSDCHVAAKAAAGETGATS